MKALWQRWLNWWTYQHRTNERQHGAGRLLAYLVLVSLLLISGFLIWNLVLFFGYRDNLHRPYIFLDIGLLVLLTAVFWLNRRGWTHQAAQIYLLAMIFVMPYPLIGNFQQQAVLMLEVPILCAAFLICPSCSMLAAALAMVSYSLSFLVAQWPEPFDWTVLVVFFLVGALAWLLAERSNRILAQSRAAAQTLAEREEELRFITENMADVIWVMDVETQKLTYISPTVENLLGYTVEETLAISPLEFIHPEDRYQVTERLPERVKDFLAGKPGAELRTNEMRQRHKDGRWIPLEITSRLSKNEDGRLVVIGSSRDITWRIEVEEALRESEETYRQLFEAESDALFLIDNLEGRLLQANQAAVALYGYSHEELMGMKNTDLSAEPAETRKATTENPPDIHRVVVIPLRWHKKKDGTVFPVEITARLFNYHGLPVHIAAIRDISARLAAEQALRDSETLMRYIVQHDPNAIAVFDRNMNYLAVSERFLKDYGVQEADILGRNHYEIFPEMPPRWIEAHQRALKGEVVSNDDDYFERPDGSITYTRWECRPWYQGDGSIGGMIAYTEVITERKLAELALRQSEERFRSYVENASDMIFTLTLDGIFTYVSPNFQDFLGYSEEEMLGQPFSQFVHPDHVAGGYRLIARTLEEELRQESGEYRVRHKNGEWRYHSCTMRAVRDAQGQAAYMVAIARDVTERVLAQQALKESEERYRALFENNHAVMFLIDPQDGRIVDANQTAERYYGWSRDELLNMYITQINTLSPEQVKEEMQKAASQQRNYFNFKHRRKDGTVTEVEVYSGPIMLKGRTLLYSLVHDITARMDAERKVAEQLAELKRWQAVMLGREERILELKREVNELLQSSGQPPRYGAPEEEAR